VEAISRTFARKGDEIVKLNLDALQAGFDFAEAHTNLKMR
jgi:Pyruvate/2-oxoacid:ferredoxin oxidoreductase gamma subunit